MARNDSPDAPAQQHDGTVGVLALALHHPCSHFRQYLLQNSTCIIALWCNHDRNSLGHVVELRVEEAYSPRCLGDARGGTTWNLNDDCGPFQFTRFVLIEGGHSWIPWSLQQEVQGLYAGPSMGAA